MTRRQWPLAAASVWRLTAARTPSAAFPTEPRARLAVASYPFRKTVNPRTGTLRLVDFPQMVADQFGVRGIEPLDEHFPFTDPGYLDRFRSALSRAGVRVVNIPVGRLPGSFYDPSEEVRRAVVDAARHWVQVAATLKSPGIRAHIRSVNTAPPNASLAAEALRRVADFGEENNVVVHLENDNPHSEEAFFLVDVIDRAGTPWLRALPDFCNSMLLDKGEEYNLKAVAAMFQRAFAICHVKDSEQEGKKFYRIDLAHTFAIAARSGYRGYFSMEYDAEGDPYAPTRRLIEDSLRLLALPVTRPAGTTG